MALIECPECGKKISDSSDKCINCGYVLNKKSKCPECGKSVSPTDKVCKNCGYKLSEKKSQNNIFENRFLVIGICVLLILVIAIPVIINNANMVEVPDVLNVDVDTAKTILGSNGIIADVSYSYSDSYEEGMVYDMSPYAGTKINKNSRVTIYISKGPSIINSKDSVIEWHHIGSKEDKWEFANPYIEDGYLMIDCSPVFGTSFKWKDNGFGRASITDTFDKTVPISFTFSDQNVKAGVKQSVVIKVPTQDLDVSKPTTLYLSLSAENSKGDPLNININFSISW